jgi:hypothetical protein
MLNRAAQDLWRVQQEIASSARKAGKVAMSPVSTVRPLKVPDRHVAAFKTLLGAQEDDFTRLMSVLDAAEPANTPNELAETIQRGTDLSVSDARGLLDAVMELAALKQRSLSSSDHMAARVAASSQFAVDGAKGEEFMERTKLLLNSDLIRLHGKVSSIGSEYERVFINSQILTDLRPVFNDKIAEDPEPEAALLSHTLSLHYVGSDGKHDNFYVVLDDDDLRALNQVTDRALRKSVSLRKKLGETGLIYIRTEE